jgi:hypothetical protein
MILLPIARLYPTTIAADIQAGGGGFVGKIRGKTRIKVKPKRANKN